MLTNDPGQLTRHRLEPFRLETWIVAVALASLAAIAIAANSGPRALAAAAAAAFALAIIVAGANAAKKNSGDQASDATAVLRQTTRLSIWTLAWSSAALFAAYSLEGLKWRHGWQYALGYAVLAAAFALFQQQLFASRAAPGQAAVLRNTRTATALFAIAIAGAVTWMIASGKLMTRRQDWLANDIFLASAAAIFALSLLLLFHTRRKR